MGRMSTYSNRGRLRQATRWLSIAAVGLIMGTTAISCGGRQAEQPARPATAATSDKGKAKGKDKGWDRTAAEAEYRLIQSELNLIKTGKPYLVLDFGRDRLLLKLKGAIVWNYPMVFADDDAGQVDDFRKRFQEDAGRLIRPLTGKHLFAAKGQTSDSVLAIVSSAVKVDPSTLQRELPERFQLRWGDDLVLEVRTEITGTPVSRFHNAVVEIGRMLNLPFGESVLVVKIKPEEGLTLYRATPIGMPTLIYQP